MPPFTADALPDDAPLAGDPALPNPALGEASLKAIADKFRALLVPEVSKPVDAPPPAAPPAAPPTGDPKSPPTGTKAPDPALDEPAEPKPNEPITREHFKRLAQSQRAFKAKVEQLKAEHEAAVALSKALQAERDAAKAALPPNLEEINKSLADAQRHAAENARLTAQLETVALERSDKFRNWWESETAKHIKVAQAHVPAEKRTEIAKLLLEAPSSERDAAIDAILEPLSATSRRLATSALENLESLRIQRDDALAQGSAKWRELQAHEHEMQQARLKEHEARLAALTEQALKMARSHSAFQPSGDAARDAELPQREAFVRAAMAGKIDPQTAAMLPALAIQAHEQSTVTIPALKAELAKQAALIAQLQGGGVRASEGAGAKASPTENKDGTSFAAHVARLTKK